MSATIGTSQPRWRNPLTICCKLAASFTVGAVILTISQPTFASSMVCAIEASVSIVSHVIIDWTRIGFAPPTPTLPTITSQEPRRGYCLRESQSIVVLGWFVVLQRNDCRKVDNFDQIGGLVENRRGVAGRIERDVIGV